MNTKKSATTVAVLVLVALFALPVSAVLNTEQNFDYGSMFIEVTDPSVSIPLFTVVKAEQKDMGSGVIRYTDVLKVGDNIYDNIFINLYVKENSRAKKVLIMSPGQGLTYKLYEQKAIKMAEGGDLNVAILGRREDNIRISPPLNESELLEINRIMGGWTEDMYLQDMYQGVLNIKQHIARLVRTDINRVEATGWGHSLGDKFWKDYLQEGYGEMPDGEIKLLQSVDMITKYDPEHDADLINIQKEKCYEFKGLAANGTNYSSAGSMILYITALAYDPETANINSELPGLSDITNLMVFRLMNFQTWQFESPFTPDYHYLSGDFNSLYGVDENEMMAKLLDGGVVPYTPLFEDEEVACELGNVSGYEANPGAISVPVIYYGLAGGFGHYGEYWIREIGVNNDLLVMIKWYNLGGHASILFVNDRKVDNFWRDVLSDAKRI